jgi:hypothetical protein
MTQRAVAAHPARHLPVLASVAIALLLAACSGGGGGSDPVTCTSLSFDRALATPSAGDVYLEQAAGTCSTVDISVIVNGLSGIWSVSFDLVYPTALVQYQSYTLGPLLLKGNPQTPPLVVVQPTSGGLQVTMTRFLGDPNVSAVGSESLIVLRFQRVAAGTGLVDFDTSAGSTVGEVILNDQGQPAASASFGPGHGGMVIVP